MPATQPLHLLGNTLTQAVLETKELQKKTIGPHDSDESLGEGDDAVDDLIKTRMTMRMTTQTEKKMRMTMTTKTITSITILVTSISRSISGSDPSSTRRQACEFPRLLRQKASRHWITRQVTAGYETPLAAGVGVPPMMKAVCPIKSRTVMMPSILRSTDSLSRLSVVDSSNSVSIC